MPILGLGTWRSEKGKVYESVKLALKIGYPHVDCAHVYDNEHEVGQALEESFASGLKREDVFITSKLWNTYHEPHLVPKAIERTLSDLKLDYLDLYLIHWPVSFESGGSNFPKDGDKFRFTDVPIEDTWKAMEELVKQGKTKSIGVSNFPIGILKKVLAIATIPPAVNQFESHPYLPCDELIAFCKQHNIHVTAYSPLGNPDWAKVTGSSFPGLLDNEVIQKIAKKHNKSTAHVLIRWHIEREVIVLAKSTTPSRIESNLQVFDFKLDEDDLAAINELGKVNQRVVSPGFIPSGFWDQ